MSTNALSKFILQTIFFLRWCRDHGHTWYCLSRNCYGKNSLRICFRICQWILHLKISGKKRLFQGITREIRTSWRNNDFISNHFVSHTDCTTQTWSNRLENGSQELFGIECMLSTSTTFDLLLVLSLMMESRTSAHCKPKADWTLEHWVLSEIPTQNWAWQSLPQTLGIPASQT